MAEIKKVGVEGCGLMGHGIAQPPILRKMLSAGWSGRKAGIGFYDYSGDTPVQNPGLAR